MQNCIFHQLFRVQNPVFYQEHRAVKIRIDQGTAVRENYREIAPKNVCGYALLLYSPLKFKKVQFWEILPLNLGFLNKATSKNVAYLLLHFFAIIRALHVMQFIKKN